MKKVPLFTYFCAGCALIAVLLVNIAFAVMPPSGALPQENQTLIESSSEAKSAAKEPKKLKKMSKKAAKEVKADIQQNTPAQEPLKSEPVANKEISKSTSTAVESDIPTPKTWADYQLLVGEYEKAINSGDKARIAVIEQKIKDFLANAPK